MDARDAGAFRAPSDALCGATTTDANLVACAPLTTSRPGLFRPSASIIQRGKPDVDARAKREHDESNIPMSGMRRCVRDPLQPNEEPEPAYLRSVSLAVECAATQSGYSPLNQLNPRFSQ